MYLIIHRKIYITYTVLHMFRQVLFWAGNQGNHQNFEKSLLSYKLWLAFFACFWAYVGQPDGFWRSWKTQFFWVGHFEFFFSKKKNFFCFIPMKTCQSLLVSKDFSKFWWLPWFPAPNSTCLNICNTVYIHIFLYRQGETDKHITNECYELWHVTFLLPKGSAYTSKFSTMILRLLKAFFGLISSIFEGFWCSVLIKAIWVP